MPESESDVLTSSIPDLSVLQKLEADLEKSSAPKQLRLLVEIASYGQPGYQALQAYLKKQQDQAAPNFIQGKCYEILQASNDPDTLVFLENFFPHGVVPLVSEREIDYDPLRKLLVQKNYLEADRLTLEKLCELAGEVAIRRKWVYFTEVEQMPIADLQTLNQLWTVHSEGKFGFSVQRQLWLSVGCNWESLWSKISWKNERSWARYPDGFIWDLQTAPKGHLPLSNQLRGVQMFNALLSHPAWDT